MNSLNVVVTFDKYCFKVKMNGQETPWLFFFNSIQNNL